MEMALTTTELLSFDDHDRGWRIEGQFPYSRFQGDSYDVFVSWLLRAIRPTVTILSRIL